MHSKFLKHGSGSPRKAVEYLLGELDHKGDKRPHIEILRGDPETFVAIAESLDFKYRYTSGVIAWSLEDDPTPEEIQETLDAYEKHAFAGLDPTRYHFHAVLHEAQDGSKHVHILIPRVDLETGKSLNIAPPGHEKYFDKVRDYLNEKHGWSKPDDIAVLNASVALPHHTHAQRAAAVELMFKGKTKADKREILNQIIQQRIAAGVIKDRSGVQATLAEYGIITRTRKNTISVKFYGDSVATQIGGVFYEAGFTLDAYAKARARAQSNLEASRRNGVDAAELKKLDDELQRAHSSRAKYFADKYTILPEIHRQRDAAAVPEHFGQHAAADRLSRKAQSDFNEPIEANAVHRRPSEADQLANAKLSAAAARSAEPTTAATETDNSFIRVMYSVASHSDHNFIGEVNERITAVNQSASQLATETERATADLYQRAEEVHRALRTAQHSTNSADERRATSGLFKRIYQRILKTNAGLFGKNLNQCLEGIKYRSVSPRQDQSANSADAQRYSGYSIEINTDPFTDFYRQLTSKYHRSQRTLNDFGRLTERFDHTIKESNRVLTAINSKGFAIKPKSPIDAARIFSYSYVSAAKDVKYWAEIQELKYHKKNPMGTELYEAICEKYNALQHFSRQEKDMTDQMRDHIQQMIASDKRMVKFAEKRLGTYFSQREHDHLDSLFDTAKHRFKKPVEVSQVRDIEPTPTPTPTPSPSKDDGYRYDPF
ncbi:relaxase/mobilization nuclease domain-containing protein [Acinetobacter sp. YH12114]|uniref:relaxase/mobilization nuclease domain-containing protein n=2 Tax=unclassified Acinetobacter TaxID=196816 RepID=UPI0015D21833|nr:relaxase/mobilization nuclease domain-containing protein [Acinetobacter sp. YH12114]